MSFLADIQLIQPAVVIEMGGSAAVLDWGTFWPPALGHVCELTTWSVLCVCVTVFGFVQQYHVFFSLAFIFVAIKNED